MFPEAFNDKQFVALRGVFDKACIELGQLARPMVQARRARRHASGSRRPYNATPRRPYGRAISR